MESRFKILGHPAHQILIVFPLGLLITAVVFDGIHRATGDGQFANIAFWMIVSGVIGGLVAAVPGWIDWFAIPSGTRAKRIGLIHGLGNTVLLGLYAASWFLRREDPHNPTMVAQLLSLAGVALGTVTAWLGGELVDRLGVGVDPGAHLDSPHSLSGRPASDRAAASRGR
jgi:uncharacterized membrane protein